MLHFAATDYKGGTGKARRVWSMEPDGCASARPRQACSFTMVRSFSGRYYLEVGMKLRTSVLILLLASFIIPAAAQTKPSKAAAAAKPKSSGEVVDRVGNTGFVQIHAESFRSLSPKEKELAYWLTQAAIAIDPIIYDQLSWY